MWQGRRTDASGRLLVVLAEVVSHRAASEEFGFAQLLDEFRRDPALVEAKRRNSQTEVRIALAVLLDRNQPVLSVVGQEQGEVAMSALMGPTVAGHGNCGPGMDVAVVVRSAKLVM